MNYVQILAAHDKLEEENKKLKRQLKGRDTQIGVLCESHRELEASKGYCCCGDCPPKSK